MVKLQLMYIATAGVTITIGTTVILIIGVTTITTLDQAGLEAMEVLIVVLALIVVSMVVDSLAGDSMVADSSEEGSSEMDITETPTLSIALTTEASEMVLHIKE